MAQPIEVENGINVLKLLEYLEENPIMIGPPKPLINAYSKMGLIGGGEKDVPGWVDNVYNALKDEDPILYRTNRKGGRVYGRWYEILEDGSILTLIGDYLSFPIGLLGSIYQTYNNSSEKEIKEFIEKNKMKGDEHVKKMKEIQKGYEEHEIKKILAEAELKKANASSSPSPTVPSKGASSYYYEMDNVLKENYKVIDNLVEKFDNAYQDNMDTQKAFRDYVIRAEQDIAAERGRSEDLENLSFYNSVRIADIINTLKEGGNND